MGWTTDEEGNDVYVGEDNTDTQTVYTDNGVYYTESPDNSVLSDKGYTDDEQADGNIVRTYHDGSVYNYDKHGNIIDAVDKTGAKIDTTKAGTNTNVFEGKALDYLSKIPKTVGDAIVKRYTSKGGDVNWANLIKDGAFAYAAAQSTAPKQAGYNVPIPELVMQRQQLNYNDPNRRPGSAGLQYFTDPKYAAKNDTTALAAAKMNDDNQAQGIKAAYTPADAPAVNPYAGKTPMPWATPASAANINVASPPHYATSVPEPEAAAPTDMASPPHYATSVPEPEAAAPFATGGLASFAKGGANYLQGTTDGMADKLNTSIDDRQAAKLSHGEFVIPADVVSHLGNGNSDAGAQKLYDMMARIRKARTGNPEQGKRINPDKFMPGGLAKYSGGGAIAFAGPDGSVVPAPATPAASTSTTDVLSEWAGPAVSSTLSKGYAASNAPFQTYTGPLTAGATNNQLQAFAGASDMASAGYTPSTFSNGTFNTAAANQYMNPYLSASLDPQLKELQRQSQINNTANAGRATQAGAYGGSRQAILQGEENRNLLDKSQGLISSGYRDAYDKAMAQFNSEQNRGLTAQQNAEQSRQFAAGNALDVNRNLQTTGATQRDIEQQGITADKTAFETQRDNPLKMAQYQKDLLSGLPITTKNTNVNTSDYANLLGKFKDLQTLYNYLNKT